jgi:hypothetical protein
MCVMSQAFLSSPRGYECIGRIGIRSSSSLNGGLFGLDKKEDDTNNAKNPTSSSLTTMPQSSKAALPIRVMEIPVKSIKRGGLRFVLGLHLVGLQDSNNKVSGIWKPNEATDNTLDMYYKDNSAMFKIILNDNAILVERYSNPVPSLAYLLQESVVLHGVLDELTILSSDSKNIETSNRLLQLHHPENALEIARAKLPARKA